uniref:Reverse transcriptase domain-containing protein n=1 Tax=Panagrolaimus sp. JU765 TaxID=591449 RepID=A0AC34RES4_9BILA
MGKLSEKDNAGKTKVKYAEIRELAEAEEARRGYSMLSTKESTKVNKIQGSSERKCFKCKGPFPGCGCSKSKKKGPQQKKPPSRPCSFCGESHYDTECPKFKKAVERDREWTKKKEKTKVSVVKVNLCQDGLNKIVDYFLLDGTKTKFMVDTGSKIDLINVEAWKSLKKPRLRKPDILIKGIGVQDKFIKCFGYMVSIIIDPETDKLVESKVYVIENDENILGLRSINGLEYLVVRKKKVIVSSTDILSKDEEQKFVDGLKQDYKDVFKPELGTLKVEPVRLQMIEGSKPIQIRARQIPYAYKQAAREAFQKQVDKGVFSFTTQALCTAPLVFVPKPIGMRVCADYSSLNKNLEDHHTPIPLVEELFNNLNDKKVFSLIDLSDAYSQVLLDEESRKLMAVATMDGIYLCNRLPQGAKPAPAIFQNIM